MAGPAPWSAAWLRERWAREKADLEHRNKIAEVQRLAAERETMDRERRHQIMESDIIPTLLRSNQAIPASLLREIGASPELANALANAQAQVEAERDRRRQEEMTRAWSAPAPLVVVRQYRPNPLYSDSVGAYNVPMETVSTTQLDGAYFPPAGGNAGKPAPKIPEILPTNRKRKIVFD